MNHVEQCKAGVQTAAQSFSFLWQHKKLIAYPAIPLLISLTVKLPIYMMMAPSNDPLMLVAFL